MSSWLFHDKYASQFGSNPNISASPAMNFTARHCIRHCFCFQKAKLREHF